MKCTVSGQVSVRSIDIPQLPGTATGVAFELPFPILQKSLDDFVLVEDNEIE